MWALTNLEENDGAFADDLVDDERWHDHEEYRAKGQDEVELSPENVLVRVPNEEASDLAKVLLGHLFVFQKLCLRHSKMRQNGCKLDQIPEYSLINLRPNFRGILKLESFRKWHPTVRVAEWSF